MTLSERFAKLVEALYAVKDAPVQTDQGGLLIRHRTRIFHLGLNAAREEVTISTAVFYSMCGGGDLYPDMIADFNAYHLFHGGYRMGVSEEDHALFVSQASSLNALETIGLESYLDTFAARCGHCAKWCMDEIAKRPPPEFDFTDLDLSDISGLSDAQASAEAVH